MENRKIDFEKIGVYIAAVMIFFTIIFYIIEMKVAIAQLEVKVDHLQQKEK